MSRVCADCGVSIEDRPRQASLCRACVKKRACERDRVRKHKKKNNPLASTRNKQCVSCRFYDFHLKFCNFAIINDVTRLALHKGELGINNPCQEYKPKKGGAKECGTKRWNAPPRTESLSRTV